jgi:ABC-type uncharacterized transport system YnjBCD ATPase subunit
MNFGGIDEPEYSSFDAARVLMLPVAYEGTVSYGTGTGAGAMAIVNASRNMELYEEETDSEVYKIGIHTLPEFTPRDTPEEMMADLYAYSTELLKTDKFLCMLGGEHSVSAPIIKAHREKYPDLSVLENLTFVAARFDTTVAEARPILAPIWVQLEPFSGRRAGALSGGMKQKLALCCALVHRPEILFLDEPTTGVDAVSRKEFWDLLARLRANGLPIVVSTPYMDEAVRCDRVSLMQGGRLLVTDRPAAIGRAYPRPILAVRGPDTLGLLGALRAFPHAAAVWPFGESLPYTDRLLNPTPSGAQRRHPPEEGV